MIAAEIQPVGDHAERAVQAEFGIDRPVGEMVAAVQVSPHQDLRPHDAVGVVVPAVEQHAPESFRRPRRIGGHRVQERLRNVSRGVDHCFPAVSEHGLGILVERVDASFQQVTGVEVIMGGHLEQLAPGLPDDEVVVGVQADVARLPNVTDPRVLFLIAIGRCQRYRRSTHCPR